MSNDNLQYEKKFLPGKVLNIGMALLAIGLIVGALAFVLDPVRAGFSYLLGFFFVLTIGVGALFIIALEYVAGADWSTPMRRVPEFLGSSVPFFLLLAVPLFFLMNDLYHWTHTAAVESDPILKGKEPYLNISFFIIRVVVIFVLWSAYYFFVVRNSRKQDETRDQKLTKKNIVLSAVFIPIFAITLTLAGIDWMMSLDAHWFSTIYGVYVFSGALLAGLAATTLAVVMLKERGYLHPRMHNDSLASLGGLLFAFINFWAYIAFSQFLLIWYANLPEETVWFIRRWEGAWSIITLVLIVVHFLVPYTMLVSAPSKKNPKRLKFAAVWILFAHLIDLYWLIMPEYHGEKSGFIYVLTEFGFPIAMIGGLVVLFYFNFNKHNAVPVGDPKLERGLMNRP
ncbi:MAG: quinol:cytochrome C oxidoreductase [Ignavibacteriales bacterium]|nr:hypothetical protein [Ignavibacteriaceae bacterium]MCZ2143804.1 quinol:cytochrome C oxidoreductase [Ignavibacteriales bacterium]WKZ72771.1 MAG: quinol:cytochrome C oxidoreductase [Ignavibacteriaceae bacterium]